MKPRSPRWRARQHWELDDFHFSGPVSPLMASFAVETLGPGSARGLGEWSVPVQRYRYCLINGWVYGRADPSGFRGGDPPAFANRSTSIARLWRINPWVRGRMLRFDRFVREGGFERSVARWDEEWRPEAERRLAPLRAFDLDGSANAELAAHQDALYGFFLWQWGVHINIHVLCAYLRARFLDVCERLLGLTEFEAYELVQRADPFHFEANVRLARMARQAAEDATVRQALDQPTESALAALRGSWLEREVQDFLDVLGDRSATFELIDPTWREMPELVLAIVKDLMLAPYDIEGEEAEFQAARARTVEKLRGRLDAERRAEFDRWLALGERAYPLNETHNYLLYELPLGLTRYAALEAGRRLVRAGALAAVDDVFFLRREEITRWLRGGRPAGLSATAAARREEHEWAARLDPPPSVGRDPGPPPVAALPPAAGAAVRLILEQAGSVSGRSERAEADGTIVGSSGGLGVAEGTVRVVRTLAEFDKVEPGDVLVCPFTNPAWTVLFSKAVAIVADSGGALSHAAIIAREYGLPSVVGTTNATRTLEDGQRVVVDGNAGTVRILSPAAVPPGA